jgi:predicted DNA-binding transcriptional regulator AlpA
MDETPVNPLMDAVQVGQWLRVSRGWVLDHASGRRRPFLKSVKIGKSVRFRPSDVESFLRECERVVNKTTKR